METLERRPDFLAANSGARAPMPGFVLLAKSRGVDAAPRLGITVTRKIGNAVVRNRMKRRFRALGREVLAPRAAPGTDYVLIGRADGVERPYALLAQELARAVAKVARR